MATVRRESGELRGTVGGRSAGTGAEEVRGIEGSKGTNNFQSEVEGKVKGKIVL